MLVIDKYFPDKGSNDWILDEDLTKPVAIFNVGSETNAVE